MKRILLVLITSLLSLSAFSQSLTGKWESTEKETESEDDFTMQVEARTDISFTGANTFTEEARAVIIFTSEEKTMSMTITLSVPGKWEKSGNKLTMVPNPKKISIETQADNVPGVIKTMIGGPVKSELKKELKKPQHYEIVSLTETTLTLKDLDEKDDSEADYQVLTRVR